MKRTILPPVIASMTRYLSLGLIAAFVFPAQSVAQNGCDLLKLRQGEDHQEIRIPLGTYIEMYGPLSEGMKKCLWLEFEGRVEFMLSIDPGPMKSIPMETSGVDQAILNHGFSEAWIDDKAIALPYFKTLDQGDESGHFTTYRIKVRLTEIAREVLFTPNRYLIDPYSRPTLVAALTRLEKGPCYMNAAVWDNGNRRILSGDVAYYNWFEEGVAEGLAAGEFVDPGTLDILEGLVEGAQALDQNETPGNIDWSEELRTWGGENVGSDNFGLTLVDVEVEGTGTDNPLFNVGRLMTSFHIAFSGVIPPPDPDSDRSAGAGVMVRPSVVTAGSAATNLYTYKRGKPGFAQLGFFWDEDSSVIHGAISALLVGDYRDADGKPTYIRLYAVFRALRGVRSCHFSPG